MKLAFSIVSHKKPDILFEKLLARLNEYPDACIAVHHDYSQSEFPEELIAKYNLHMIQPYHKTSWSHISVIHSVIDTFIKIKSIVPDFDWVVTLSQNCYPIKNTQQVLDFFTKADCDYFMETNPVGIEYGSIYKWHYEALFTKRIGQIPFISRKGKFYWRSLRIPIDRRKTGFDDSMYPYTGSQWGYMNRKTVEKIIAADIVKHPISLHITKANLAPDVNTSPDEIIFQTFVKNQKDLVGINKNYRFIDWTNAKNWHPNTLTMDFWDKIKGSDGLFARKFDWKESAILIEKIDKELLS